ncbi:hypothetical protein EON66_02740 [archaeon]|nr:MAG: hypothetical protein EON66_02740 [archaeon]
MQKTVRQERRRDKLVARIKKITAQRHLLPPSRGALAAFVSFERQQGFVSAMRTYSGGFIEYFMQDKTLRLQSPKHGLYRVKVRPAPSPSIVLYVPIPSCAMCTLPSRALAACCCDAMIERRYHL